MIIQKKIYVWSTNSKWSKVTVKAPSLWMTGRININPFSDICTLSHRDMANHLLALSGTYSKSAWLLLECYYMSRTVRHLNYENLEMIIGKWKSPFYMKLWSRSCDSVLFVFIRSVKCTLYSLLKWSARLGWG
jgi:hypothetical protein